MTEIATNAVDMRTDADRYIEKRRFQYLRDQMSAERQARIRKMTEELFESSSSSTKGGADIGVSRGLLNRQS